MPTTAHPRPHRRRRPDRARARRRSRLARRAVHADREDRRPRRASEDGPHRRAHHGVLPPLGHRRPRARRAVSARLSAGLCLARRRSPATSSAARNSPAAASSRCPPESPQKRERVPQDMFDPIIKQWATEFPSVTLHHNTELVGFEDCGTHVLAHRARHADRRDARDRRRLPDRHRRRRLVRARDARHPDERASGAHLHHQRDLPLPGPRRRCTTRGTAIASSSSGRKAPG